jgi:hypothetical protein
MDTFSLSYLNDNLQAIFDFLFDISNRYPNSAILAVVGISGLFVILINSIRKRPDSNELTQLTLIAGLAVVNVSVVLIFNYGLFTTYATSRLSLPLNFFLAIWAAFAFKMFPKQLVAGSILLFILNCFVQTFTYEKPDWLTYGWIVVVLVFVVLVGGHYFYQRIHAKPFQFLAFLLLLSLAAMAPKMRAKPYYHRYVSPHDMNYFLDFIQKNKSEDTLFVSIYQYLPILCNQNGVLPEHFIFATKTSMSAFEEGHYQRIYLLHRKFPDTRTAKHIQFEEFMEYIPQFEAVLVDKQRSAPEVFVYIHELRLKEASEKTEAEPGPTSQE